MIKTSIRELQEALHKATASGALYVLTNYVHPDHINEFCDGVSDLKKALEEEQ